MFRGGEASRQVNLCINQQLPGSWSLATYRLGIRRSRKEQCAGDLGRSRLLAEP